MNTNEILSKNANEITNEEFNKIYEELTPENQVKVLMKYCELMIEEGKLFHIKAILPTSGENERDSFGESVFVIVKPDAKTAYDNDEIGTTCTGILDNDSFDYPGLRHGTQIPLIMNGTKKPFVPYKWLFENYGKPQE